MAFFDIFISEMLINILPIFLFSTGFAVYIFLFSKIIIYYRSGTSNLFPLQIVRNTIYIVTLYTHVVLPFFRSLIFLIDSTRQPILL